MNVEGIEVETEQLHKELADLKQAVKEGIVSKKNPLTRDLLKVLGHLEHGGKIVDVFKTFEKTQLREDGLPKIAITPADSRFCYLYQKQNGGAIFSREKKGWNKYKVKSIGDVLLPADTFDWIEQPEGNTCYRTLTPIIPPRINIQISARILPTYYHIIFEVESWEKRRPKAPVDPILGKMLTNNLFGVIATWDITPLEKKILEGQ